MNKYTIIEEIISCVFYDGCYVDKIYLIFYPCSIIWKTQLLIIKNNRFI